MFMFRFPDACHGLASRALPAGVRKATRHEIAGSGHYGSSNLSTGYGDLKYAPVAASTPKTGGSKRQGLLGKCTGEGTAAETPPASAEGGASRRFWAAAGVFGASAGAAGPNPAAIAVNIAVWKRQ